jgi:hypothetical protein
MGDGLNWLRIVSTGDAKPSGLTTRGKGKVFPVLNYAMKAYGGVDV